MGDAVNIENDKAHASALPNGHGPRADECAPLANGVNGTRPQGPVEANGDAEHAEHAANGADGAEPADETAEAPGQRTSLLSLPPELLDVVLAHVPPAQKLSTVRALSLVLPYSVSRRWRWEHLVLSSPRQFYPLYKALARERERRLKGGEEGRAAGRGGDELVRTLCVDCWKGDVDMLNNVLRLIPSLETLMLHVGTNFAPEHLEDMFSSPRPDLSRLELRFRPYVEEANYYQFLKGSYFDKALHTLQTWPETPSFRYLALVQDLLPRKHLPIPRTRVAKLSGASADPEEVLEGSDGPDGVEGLERDVEALSLGPSEEGTPALTPARGTPGTVTPGAGASGAQTPADPPKDRGYTGQGMFPYLSQKLQDAKPRTFAQPIVFFDVRCVAFLGASPVAKHLTHFRLRVPSRDIAYVLVTKPEPLAPVAFATNTAPAPAPNASATMFPALTYLDISTTNVRLDAVLATLLRNYERLEHLVLDRTNLFGFRSKDKGELMSRELGGLCVTVSLQRAKEREKALGAWDARQRTAAFLREQAQHESQRSAAAVRGLSAAERAERELQRQEDEEAERQAHYARARRGHRSAGQSTISLRTNSRRNQALAAAAGVHPADLPPSNRAWFVLPALPRLRSVNIGGEAVGVSRFYDLAAWRHAFRDGWVESVQRNLGWARNTADKYARARKKIAEWHAYTGSLRTGAGAGTGKKGKAAGAKSQPPLDVRLFRYPVPGEDVPEPDAAADSEDRALAGLIEIDDAGAAQFIAAYKDYLGDCERIGGFPCVFCTTPDCEGPYRRGGEGERVDGRGGMDAPHEPGCGHLLGRTIWGWEGVE